jgi:hypothetical protein
MVGEKGAQTSIVSGLQELYVGALSLLFAFLGNKETVVLYTQFIVQIITVVVLYVAVRLISGRMVAMAVGIVVVCSTGWAEAVTVVQPEVLLMFMWSLVLLLIALIGRVIARGGGGSKGAVVGRMAGALGIGILCGGLIGLDWLGLLLLLYAFFTFTHADYSAIKHRWLVWLINMLLLTGGAVLGGWLIFLRETMVRDYMIINNIASWLDHLPVRLVPTLILPTEPPFVVAVYVLLAGLSAVAFWLGNKRGFSLWMGEMLVVGVIAPSLGLFYLDRSMWITLVWAVLAGIGIQKMISAGRYRTIALGGKAEAVVGPVDDDSKVDVSDKVDDSSKVDAGSLVEDNSKVEDNRESEGERSDIIGKKANKAKKGKKDKRQDDGTIDYEKLKKFEREKLKNKALEGSLKGAEGTVESSRYDGSTGTKYIDNPLPLPPKPVRRVMDYPRKVAANKMYFEIEVSPDDDYDR